MTAAELDEGPSPPLGAPGSSRPLHLFWDDADKLKPTEFKYGVLFDLVDRIYRNEHSLTITSNLDIEKLEDVLTPAMVRRIDDICIDVEI